MYVGPLEITSVAKVREMPYLTSSQVTFWPSCHFAVSTRVNFHVLPPSDIWPVSVARSGTILLSAPDRVGDRLRAYARARELQVGADVALLRVQAVVRPEVHDVERAALLRCGRSARGRGPAAASRATARRRSEGNDRAKGETGRALLGAHHVFSLCALSTTNGVMDLPETIATG